MEALFRDTAYVMWNLLPRRLRPYFVPQVQEAPVYKQENKWWLEWLDFEL